MKWIESIIAAWRRRKWARLTQDERQAIMIFDRMSPKMKARLMAELEDDTESRRLQQSEEDFAQHEQVSASERLARLPETRAEHARFIEQLLKR
jgi:hypothetical protein